jgi:hypothetical protein
MVTGRELELMTTRLKTEFNLAAVFAKPYSPRELVSFVRELTSAEQQLQKSI